MCSTQCPCDGTDPEDFEEWSSYTEAGQTADAELEAYEQIFPMSKWGRKPDGANGWKSSGTAAFYRWGTGYNYSVPLTFNRDGFVRTTAVNGGAVGDFVQYDGDSCECLSPGPEMFSNA
jgi:hypothetical protein